MLKIVVICSMCLMLLLSVGVSAQTEMPQGAPQGNMEMPQGTPPQGQNAEAMTPPGMDFGGGNMQGSFNFGGTQTQAEPMTFTAFVKEYQTPVISVVLLLSAFVFVKLYKRKNY